MDFFLDTGPSHVSEEVLQLTLDNTMLTWRAELEEVLPPFVWETAARERSRSDVSEKDDRMSRLGTSLVLGSINAEAMADSYERFFSYEPISVTNGLRDYLDSFPSQSSHSFQLIISDDERRVIMGMWTDTHYSSLIQPSGKGITDQYTGKRIFLRQMSTTKIRKDLYFLLQRRLFSDMQVVVPASQNRDIDDEDRVVAVFPCHKSILVARSPYFRNVLLGVDTPTITHQRPENLFIVPLPSPPFNPVTVDFTLRFLYTGVLQFPLTKFSSDYSTTIALYRASQYLQLPSLKALIVSYIIADMLHGCFSASLTASEYYRLTEGKWKNMISLGGCSCRHCARRAPRILAFSLEPDIQDSMLEQGARRALVGMFGPSWCTQELGSLPNTVHTSLLASLGEMITPRNALSLLFAAEKALLSLGDISTFWDKPIRPLIISARQMIVDVICRQSRPSFYCDEWRDLITDSSRSIRKVAISTSEEEREMSWIVNAVSKSIPSLQPQVVSSVYQTLTWFTDAQVTPEKQNKRLMEMMGSLKEELLYVMTHSQRLSTISSASSIFEPIDPSHRSVVALDLSDGSVYSYPSSRTMSTDYGIYYTRLAISQDTVETVTLQRRRSWDTLSVYTEIQD